MRDQDLTAPLASDGDRPTLYASLGATIHLEPLGPDDAEGLAEAAAMLHEWLAPSLRHTQLACWDGPLPHAAEHVEYIGEYPKNLVFDRSLDDPEDRLLSLRLQTQPFSDYEVTFHGGPAPEAASPHLLSFWSEIPRLDPDLPVAALSALSIRVPVTTDPAELRARVLAAASKLRIQWANVGYTYSFGGADDDEAWDAMYAHARRFAGFDVPEIVRNMDVFGLLLRSVNWITILGQELAGALEPAALDAARARGLVIDPFGAGGLVIQAGAGPERGDRNRRAIPPLYVAADALVRGVRARDAEADEIVFLGPWEYPDVTDWLNRFEVRLWGA
jgi:hypothetical protein